MDLGTRHDTAEIFDGFKMFDFRWRRISKANTFLEVILTRALVKAQTKNMLRGNLCKLFRKTLNPQAMFFLLKGLF